MSDFFSKLRLKFLYHLAQLFTIEPFLRVNPNAYCPCCGSREGKIHCAVLEKPDGGGSCLANHHRCAVCAYEWLESSVTTIKDHIMGAAPEEDPERRAVGILEADRRTKNVRVSPGTTKVNGQVVS